MRGDFSRWVTDLKQNYSGLLQQQGRVFLDSDWNEQVRISEARRQTMLRDVVGANIAAVPAELPESLKVIKAEVTADNKIWLDTNAGRVWINGVSLEISGEFRHRVATYLSSSTGSVADIGDGIRDAVILELWQEELNSFQNPQQLLESALGGPDTTEKIHTGMALRLLRLNEEENCRNIKEKIAAEDNNQGKLLVTLEPNSAPPVDCPEVETGGYAGFEHNLYRIEIAHNNQGPNSNKAKFKWSNVNGGLVGRGTYDGTDPLHKKIILTANQPAIVNSQKDNFYLEILEYDGEAGRTNVTFGAEATLNGNVLELGQEHYVTSAPSTTEVFFRLWDGIKLISDFPKTGDAKELKHGIRLAFDGEASSLYRPEDYWTVDVRVGQKYSATPLINDEKPQGIVYHRAPLGILNWDSDKTITFEEEQIDDCRHVFRPLTRQNICCTYTIGDGKSSQGDFNDFNLALRHLPKDGGQLCLLPGKHEINAELKELENIRVTGCGIKTVVHPQPGKENEPIFTIKNSKNIQIDDLTIVSFTGVAIAMTSTVKDNLLLNDIEINNNFIISGRAAIAVYDGNNIRIHHNQLSIIDIKKGLRAIFLKGEDCLITDNKISVVPDPKKIEEENPDDGDSTGGDPGEDVFDDCNNGIALYLSGIALQLFIQWIFLAVIILEQTSSPYNYQALGGIQIGSTSERVNVKRNNIIGGRSHGIVLGHLPSPDGTYPNDEKFIISDLKTELKALMENKFEGFLYDIVIKDNVIRQMGLNGISVVSIINFMKSEFMVSVYNLTIIENTITKCAQQLTEVFSDPQVTKLIGFGGIILSDVEDLMLQQNRIEDNGISHLIPVCGIFIMHGENLDISNNFISNNGPRIDSNDSNATIGMRGGIVISMIDKASSYMPVYAGALDMAPIAGSELYGDSSESTMGSSWGVGALNDPLINQAPAAKINDNYVSQPLGHALVLLGIGPMTILGNHLVSRGASALTKGAMLNKGFSNVLGMLSSTVLIFNLGVCKDILDVRFLGSINSIIKGNSADYGKRAKKEDYLFDTGFGRAPMTESHWGLAGKLSPLLLLPSGSVMFSNNRVTLDIRNNEAELLSSSIAINAPMGDIAFSNNQSEIETIMDAVISNTQLNGFSVRTVGNRFQEALTKVKASLYSMGFMNATFANQATHCIFAAGAAKYLKTNGNAILMDGRCPNLNKGINRKFGLNNNIRRTIVKTEDMVNNVHDVIINGIG